MFFEFSSLLARSPMNSPDNVNFSSAESGAESEDARMFELAPVSLWLEDYSGLKALFEEWRSAGVADLRAYLRQDLERVKLCASRLRVVKVNRRTLTLFEVADVEELVASLGSILRDDMLLTHLEELVQLWEGKTKFCSDTVNYTMSGRRLDIQPKGAVLPGYEQSWARVLIAIEDVTDRETARRKLTVSEDYARGLLQHSPVSLWVEDFSRVGQLIEEARERGIGDSRIFTDVHPEFVQDEFAIVMPNADGQAGEAMVEDIHRLAEINNQSYGATPLSFSMGIATSRAGERLEASPKGRIS
jgi:PAS domain-containing protein